MIKVFKRPLLNSEYHYGGNGYGIYKHLGRQTGSLV